MVKREYIVEVLNGLRDNNSVSLRTLTDIIKEYCLEKGKKEEDIDNFISAMIRMIPLGSTDINQCSLQALEYYKNKFNICDVSHNSRILLYY